MFNKQFSLFQNPKYIVFNTLKMTLVLPATIMFFTNMGGSNIGTAFNNSFGFLLNPMDGLFFWALIIILNVLIYFYLKPVFIFSHDCNNFCVSKEKIHKMAINRFNKLLPFFIIISIGGFFMGYVMDFIFNIEFIFALKISLVYDMMESISTGMFAGVLMYLNTENILYPAKERVFYGDLPQKQKYTSFYSKLTLTVAAIVLFLIFQIFDSFSEFYYMGALGPETGFHPNPLDIGELFDLSRQDEALKDIVKVLLMKIFIYGIYVVHLFRQIRKMIINPLETVQGKLEGLNSDNPELSKEIDIINYDEFTGIYSEINKLIEKQNIKLRQSQEKLENIVENAADPIISFHSNGKIHVFNPAAVLFFGYSNSEIDNLTMTDLIDLPEDLRENCLKDYQLFIDYFSNYETSLKRFTGIHKNGDKLNFESNVSISETDHGFLYTAVLRDIAGQMEFEENLKRAKVSAEKANKMKSEFLANMSHELRTPLNAVLGFTQLLSTDKNLTKGQLDKINTISHSGEHLLALINDILDISKIEAGKIEMHKDVFDLNTFINDLKDMFILKCQAKGLTFYVEQVGEIPPYIEGDLGKLRQIMINLIGNAVKFTNEGGISLIVGQDKGEFRFSVNDTGKGIPADEIEKIQQPFMQSSNVDHEGGTGLGLTISNSFIKMMGGKLNIESQIDMGSTFSFSLPLKISRTAPVIEEDRGKVLSIKDQRAVKALIVDDKVNNRLILKTMLENVGFVTMEAENGLEAIDRTREFEPELIFMDIKMPVMDGYGSVKILKSTKLGKSIKIFALTASAFNHDEKKIIKSGFDGFLPKPFKLESLFRLISDNTAVEFLYDEADVISHSSVPHMQNLDYQFLGSTLTKEEIEKLADDILINDFAAIKEFAESLSDRSKMSDLKESLIYYADNFNDQKLEEIIEKIKGKKNG